jgi:hypothetical protein
MNNVIHLPQICLNFLDFFHRLGGKGILWEKRNFGDCEWTFERVVVEALFEIAPIQTFHCYYHCASPFTCYYANCYYIDLGSL